MNANSQVTVASLRRDGYKVRVTHKRDYFTVETYGEVQEGQTPECLIVFYRLTRKEAEGRFTTKDLSSFGGATLVEITCPDGRQLVGKANCNDKDQFNRKLAVRIALGRALMGVK